MSLDSRVVFGALTGAITWNLITWWGGLPSSSSHALIGGLIGAGTAKGGTSAIVWSGVLKTVGAIALSPLLGFMLALLLVLAVSWIFVRSTPFAVDKTFRSLQLASAALYSLGHGGNDAQKTRGIIAGLLYSEGHLGSEFYVPLWVVLSCQTAMALGTYLGGWRIVRTMGSRITRLNPMQGFCAEMGGCDHLVHGHLAGHTRFYDTYNHRRDYWCRRGEESFGCAVEYCRQHRYRLGHHAARCRAYQCVLLCLRERRLTIWPALRALNSSPGRSESTA